MIATGEDSLVGMTAAFVVVMAGFAVVSAALVPGYRLRVAGYGDAWTGQQKRPAVASLAVETLLLLVSG